MTKFAGNVGYISQVETSPGVWSPIETARRMRGDLLRVSALNKSGDGLNKDVVFQHKVSVLGDPYSYDNFYNVRWVEVRGIKWEVTSIEVSRPRLIFTLGGMYNV